MEHLKNNINEYLGGNKTEEKGYVIGAIKRYRTEDKEKFKKRKKPTKKLIDKFIVGAVL